MTLFIQQNNYYNQGFGCPPPMMPMMGPPCCGMMGPSIWSKGAALGALTGFAGALIIGSPKIRHAIGSAATAVYKHVLKPVGKFIWNGILKPVGKFIGNIFSSAFKGIKSLFKKKDKTQKS